MTHCTNWTTNNDNILAEINTSHERGLSSVPVETFPLNINDFLKTTQEKSLNIQTQRHRSFDSLRLTVKRRLMCNTSDLLQWLNVNSNTKTGCSILMTGTLFICSLTSFSCLRTVTILRSSSTLEEKRGGKNRQGKWGVFQLRIVFYNQLTHQKIAKCQNQ